jgi:hypothetical protein
VSAEADYEVAWPRDLIRRDLSDLVNSTTQKDWEVKVDLLLRDAFISGIPRDQFRGLGGSGFGVPDAPLTDQRKFLVSILRRLDSFPEPSARRPYWSERKSGASTPQSVGIEPIARTYVHTVKALEDSGYFEEAFTKDCVDDPSTVSAASLIADLVGRDDIWPLNPMRLVDDLDAFFDVVEVLHDLVARPRNGWIHDYCGCGWHYTEFSRDSGRRLYRWHVNRLLDRSDLGVRLADDGEDEGRLIAVTDNARTELLGVMTERIDDTADQVRHAIALFRQRGATEHDKRSAVTSLALVLEERRSLLKDVLYSSDEGALFEIANRFAIRHQDQRQKADYSPEFLDWTFWWYLATIELTDRVLARETVSEL